MNELINRISSHLKYICNNIKMYFISFYNKIYFLINKNFTINEIYRPIIQEKKDTNKKLHGTLKVLHHKNIEAKKNKLKLQVENELLQDKISIIQNLITKRHD